jgi:hypothetical protein
MGEDRTATPTLVAQSFRQDICNPEVNGLVQTFNRESAEPSLPSLQLFEFVCDGMKLESWMMFTGDPDMT